MFPSPCSHRNVPICILLSPRSCYHVTVLATMFLSCHCVLFFSPILLSRCHRIPCFLPSCARFTKTTSVFVSSAHPVLRCLRIHPHFTFTATHLPSLHSFHPPLKICHSMRILSDARGVIHFHPSRSPTIPHTRRSPPPSQHPPPVARSSPPSYHQKPCPHATCSRSLLRVHALSNAP